MGKFKGHEAKLEVEIKNKCRAFPGWLSGKDFTCNAETWVLSPGQEYLLGEDMGISILAWEFHGQRGLAGYSPWGHKRVRHYLATKQQRFP